MSEIVKEAIRAYHRLLDIVKNDQRYRAENVMSPSEIVNTEPNPEQAQKKSQTKKVCSVSLIEIIDTDNDNEDQEVRPIVKEAIRAYHRLLDIVEHDQRTNLMSPSEIVNTAPNPEKAQTPQTKKVCSGIEITDTEDHNEDQEVRAIQNRSKSMSVDEKKKRQYPQLEGEKQQNVEKQTSELTLQSVKKKRVDDVNASKSKERTTDLNLIESGRLIQILNSNNDILRMIYMLLERFSKIEKPNGGSFYWLTRGIHKQKNGDCVQKANCYGHKKHNCPVVLTIDYKHDGSVYKLYKSGTHNHGLNHVKTEKARKRDTFEDIKIEIISSEIADYVKDEKIY